MNKTEEDKIVKNILKNSKNFAIMDIRLYFYDHGTLRKWGSGKTGVRIHKFTSIQDCKQHIREVSRHRKFGPNWAKLQFVITEYHNTYSSNIIEVVRGYEID